MSKKPKEAKKTFRREIAAPTITEGLEHLDDMQRSFYDMYILEVSHSESRDGYMIIKIYSWENEETREIYSC